MLTEYFYVPSILGDILPRHGLRVRGVVAQQYSRVVAAGDTVAPFRAGAELRRDLFLGSLHDVVDVLAEVVGAGLRKVLDVAVDVAGGGGIAGCEGCEEERGCCGESLELHCGRYFFQEDDNTCVISK